VINETGRSGGLKTEEESYHMKKALCKGLQRELLQGNMSVATGVGFVERDVASVYPRTGLDGWVGTKTWRPGYIPKEKARAKGAE